MQQDHHGAAGGQEGSGGEGQSARPDPRAQTQEYLEKHHIAELLEGMLAELIYARPADPAAHIAAQLEKVKVAGTRPLLDKGDLAAMFGMFDVTRKGAVSEAQACTALRTVLGARAADAAVAAATAAPPDGAAELMAPGAFVDFVGGALAAATPYCKGWAAVGGGGGGGGGAGGGGAAADA